MLPWCTCSSPGDAICALPSHPPGLLISCQPFQAKRHLESQRCSCKHLLQCFVRLLWLLTYCSLPPSCLIFNYSLHAGPSCRPGQAPLLCTQLPGSAPAGPGRVTGLAAAYQQQGSSTGTQVCVVKQAWTTFRQQGALAVSVSLSGCMQWQHQRGERASLRCPVQSAESFFWKGTDCGCFWQHTSLDRHCHRCELASVVFPGVLS